MSQHNAGVGRRADVSERLGLRSVEFIERKADWN